MLEIKPTTHRDSGRYECQISTTPPTSHVVYLKIAGTYRIIINFILNIAKHFNILCANNVSYLIFHIMFLEPKTAILGGPDIHLKEGSTMNLTCVITDSPEPPSYIFWRHDDTVS